MEEATLPLERILLLPGIALFMVAVLVGFRRQRQAGDFFLAGRRAGSATVFASLLATVLGASGTSGIIGLATAKGWAACWWLGAGAIGLCLLGLFWVVPMRRKASTRTLPEWLGHHYGMPARRLAAALIALMWTAVIAAQWVAAGALLQTLLGCGSLPGIVFCATAVAAYTAVGGQASVLRTDRWQLPLIMLAILLALVSAVTLPKAPGATTVSIPGVFGGVTPLSWLAVMVVVGGMYVVGPDLCSRVLLARSDTAARRGAILAGLVLVPISFAIVAIGVRIRASGAVFESPRQALPWLLVRSGVVPPLAAGFVGGGLLAAMLSSADTCLLTAATVVELDLLAERHQTLPTGRIARILVIVIALLGVLIAAFRPGIITNLLLAYAFYSGGLLVPLLLLAFPGLVARLDRRYVWGAMVIGGTTPVAAKLLGVVSDLPMAGLFGVVLAAVLTALGLIMGKRV